MKKVFSFILVFLFLFTSSLKASDLDQELFRHELNMEKEASKLLAERLTNAYEEKVIVEDKLKQNEGKIKTIEEELSRVRELMEDQITFYRKKTGTLQQEIEGLKRKTADFTKSNKPVPDIKVLEKEKEQFQKKLARKEEELKDAHIEINRLKSSMISSAQPKVVGKEDTDTGGSRKKETEKVTGMGISAVSEKYNFVIIKVKDINCAQIGKVFSVVREDSKIGEVKVARIRGEYLFAEIINTESGKTIKQGDIALDLNIK